MRSKLHLPVRFGLALILAAALLTVWAPRGAAQEASASVTGKITDPSGAAVSNAAVTVRDLDRETLWKSQTNDEGIYSLPRLPIGKYELRVEANGFQTAVRQAFRLELNQAAKIDIALTIGQVSQQVEVSGAAPVLQTQTTEA